MDIQINKKEWSTFSEDQMEEYRELVFDHYRKTGFPFYPTNKEYRLNEFSKLKKYDFTKVYDQDVVRQTMHGLALAWSYMPHSWSVQCNGLMSPTQVFNDDDLFKRVIIKRTKHGDNMSDAGIRKTIRMFSGAQGVSNFRPTAAAAIYDRHLNGDGVVWDMSSGYGGRLLGSIISDVKKYIGTDPCEATFNGLMDMANDFGEGTEIELHKLGSEVYVPEENSLDLCFTSPPYFNTEKYSDEDTQSYSLFPTKNEWVSGFMTQTALNCHHGLKHGSKLIINIANVKSFDDLEQQTINAITRTGFKQIGTEKMALSHFNRSSTSKFKYEPIFIFECIK